MPEYEHISIWAKWAVLPREASCPAQFGPQSPGDRIRFPRTWTRHVAGRREEPEASRPPTIHSRYDIPSFFLFPHSSDSLNSAMKYSPGRRRMRSLHPPAGLSDHGCGLFYYRDRHRASLGEYFAVISPVSNANTVVLGLTPGLPQARDVQCPCPHHPSRRSSYPPCPPYSSHNPCG